MLVRSVKLSFLVWALLVSAPAVAEDTRIEYVPARSYFETALREINQAQRSVKVYMFVIAANTGEPGSKVMKLLDALGSAKERGVEVEVHLDQNYPYGSEGNEVEGKNNGATRYLKERGVAVYFDDPADYTHSKAIVIDGRVTIFGSSNWSRSAFDINNETNAIVRSEEFAEKTLEDLSRVENLVPDVPEEIKTIKIPKSFTAREDQMSGMVTSVDERAFDIYLYLLRAFDGNAEGKAKVDYDHLAKSLGIDGMSRIDYRRQISKVLRKLQDEYKLIAAEIKYDDAADVVLKDYKGGFISFPEDYWNFAWTKRLSFPAKVMLLLNWEYSGGELASWKRPIKGLAEAHHMSESFISDGIQELRRLNLIDVRYKDVAEETEGPRWAAVYSPNALYDPDELQKRFDDLAKDKGKEAVDRAKGYARIVYKENDYEDVETLIGLEKQYGRETLKEAVGILEAKAENNPKRHMGYLIGTIKGLALKQEGLKN